MNLAARVLCGLFTAPVSSFQSGYFAHALIEIRDAVSTFCHRDERRKSESPFQPRFVGIERTLREKIDPIRSEFVRVSFVIFYLDYNLTFTARSSYKLAIDQ